MREAAHPAPKACEHSVESPRLRPIPIESPDILLYIFPSAAPAYCERTWLKWPTKASVTRSLAQLYQTFPCTECQQSFSTKQALAVHSCKAHGTKRLQRRYVVTTHCEVCLVEFWTRERLVCHLAEKSSICWANYVAFPPRLSEAQANELDAVDAGSMRQAIRSGARRHSVITPCVRLSGPLCPLRIHPTMPSHHHSLGAGRRHLGT